MPISVNDHNKLLGTITDGDIRKSILTDANLDRSINNIYNKKPIKINKDSVDMNKIKNYYN